MAELFLIILAILLVWVAFVVGFVIITEMKDE